MVVASIGIMGPTERRDAWQPNPAHLSHLNPEEPDANTPLVRPSPLERCDDSPRYSVT